MGSYSRVCLSLLKFFMSHDHAPYRLGPTISSAYTLAFQTHLFSILPPTFSQGFRALIFSTFTYSNPSSTSTRRTTFDETAPRPDTSLWTAFEQLGLLDRYESLISGVCFERIETHILEKYTGKWSEPALAPLRAWMIDNVGPWMVMPYARGAKTSE